MLRAFLEVCRLGSITAAATSLGYTQSGISRQIASLEAELGVALVKRLPRGVVATRDGEQVLSHARAIIREAERMSDGLARSSPIQAHLAIGAVPSAAATILPRAVVSVLQHEPRPRVTLVEGFSPDLVARTAAGELDLSVVSDYAPGLRSVPGAALEHLVDDEVWVALPADHPSATTPGRLTLDEFRDAEWIEDYQGSAYALTQACAKAGFAPRIEHECSSLTGKIAMVAAGVGVAIVPGLMAESARADVVCRQLQDPPVRRLFVARHDSARHSPAATNFIQELRTLVA